MIKTCNTCHHTGELTWRDGKYYCAMCGSEVAETEPTVQPQRATTVNNATCPICKNRDNNLFDGGKYRCSLCGTPFELQQEYHEPTYNQSGAGNNRSQYVADLKKQKEKNIVIGVVLVFIFWPVSIYFFYKAYKNHEELKSLGY